MTMARRIIFAIMMIIQLFASLSCFWINDEEKRNYNLLMGVSLFNALLFIIIAANREFF